MRRCRHLLVALVLVTAASPPLSAQRASAWLPPDHWSRTVLIRMHAAGLHGLDPAIAVRTVDEAFAALPPSYRVRIAEERLESGEALHPPLVRMEVGLLVRALRDVLRPGGFDLERAWREPHTLRDRTSAGARLRASTTPLRWLSFSTEVEALEDRLALEEAALDVVLGSVGLWAGRRRHGYGPADGGGLVLNALQRFDGAGLRTTRPFRLPILGPASGEILAGPSPENGHVAHPWLLAMRVHFRPYARLDIGATRAAVVGRLDGGGIAPDAIAGVIIGTNLSGDHADDQVASIDARWRPPLPFPTEIYGEWGMHDIDLGVLIDVPAITVGVRLPDLDGTQRFGAGIERTSIAASCCENPPWYHHFELADGWTRDGRLLGHPLGGHGSQWRIHVEADPRSGALLLAAAIMHRSRGAENLFAPTRQGRALALDLAADARLHRRGAAALSLFLESGEHWTEAQLRASLRWRL